MMSKHALYTLANPPTKDPTDIGELSYLAPCGASALSYAIMEMTYSACPSDPGSLATCVCEKPQNSAAISQTINTEVRSSCSNTADVSSAQAFFAAYCNLNSGISSFPTPTRPSGDSTPAPLSLSLPNNSHTTTRSC